MASHAQKFFIRQRSGEEARRPSIHDLRTPEQVPQSDRHDGRSLQQMVRASGRQRPCPPPLAIPPSVLLTHRPAGSESSGSKVGRLDHQVPRPHGMSIADDLLLPTLYIDAPQPLSSMSELAPGNWGVGECPVL